ncbi:acyltransferase [Ancylostoma duodenale]|uniref:Acyltransferase n=1 Tax=Ancylostoma duodenale TaxID=51022 RepID=A0A0C2GX95_9BILA|nr:acyltransferase [Ancylostoma duodenale]
MAIIFTRPPLKFQTANILCGYVRRSDSNLSSSGIESDLQAKFIFSPVDTWPSMSEKRLDIQGLRGWAILLTTSRFFVISGFLIAMILRRSDNLDMEAFRSFYYRRIKRILPLYYLAIACILIALFFLLPPSYRSMNIDSSRRAIILISNIKKLDVDANYQKMLVNAEDLFTHTWSLCVEMQWYLLVPLIFVAQRFATAWEKTFFTGVAISSIAFYLLADEMNSFYCVLARIWQFCCGVLALLVQNEEPVKDLPQHEEIAFLDSETCEDEALLLGLVSSISMAVAAYHLFEKYYLTWPPQGVLPMLTVSVAICAILALQPRSVEEQMFGQGPVNYSVINPNDAAWNMRCEVMTWTPKAKCWRRVNYTAMVQELKPDIVFVMSRSFMAKAPFDTMKPIDGDKIFQDHLSRMTVFEKIAKKEGLIRRDDFFARQRIQEVGKRCRKCEIMDYLPVLVDGNGHYLGYNPKNNLMYLDDHNHFTRFGKERIQQRPGAKLCFR